MTQDMRATIAARLRAGTQPWPLVQEYGMEHAVLIGEVVDQVRDERQPPDTAQPPDQQASESSTNLFQDWSVDVNDAPDGEGAEQAGKVAKPKAAKPVAQKDRIVELVRDGGADLFHTPAFEPYARIAVGDHRETWPLRSKAFRRYCAWRHFQADRQAPGGQAVADALETLAGMATFDGAERPVFVRIATFDRAVWLDLANPDWQAVKITAAGWQVVADPPVRFRRARGMLEIPTATGGATLDDLRLFCNVEDDDWPLVKAVAVGLLRGQGPYVIANLLGVQGTAKTTTARALRDLVDPNTVALRSEPKDMRDLAIAAANGHVVALDNISHLPVWLSDGLCRLATGGGFATRELYSDAEEALFDFQRPVLLTGIGDLAVRGDLVDRSVTFRLPEIGGADRKPEAQFWRAYAEVRPALLGALLDATAGALAALPGVNLARLPRMADFAIWSAAASGSIGVDPAKLLELYAANRAAQQVDAVEASPAMQAVRALLADKPVWYGTATELLAALSGRVPDDTRRLRAWPKSASALAQQLTRYELDLRAVDVQVTHDRTKRLRTITLRQVST